MTNPTPQRGLSTDALKLGMLIPLIYYGIQAAAAPFFPDFSVLKITASELGSDRSKYAVLFNIGIMVQGAATVIASFGFFAVFRRLGAPMILALLTSAAIALNGVQCFWAGWFAMPDPRHGGHPVFVAGMLSMPFLLAASMWRASGGGVARWYFIANLVGLVMIAPFMSGATGLDLNEYRGLLQRIFGLTIFVPIGVAACVLSRRLAGRRRFEAEILDF